MRTHWRSLHGERRALCLHQPLLTLFLSLCVQFSLMCVPVYVCASAEQVLEAAQVQAAVLSATEAESAQEQSAAAAHRALQSEAARLQAEVDRLARENAAYRSELAAFDSDFFEELEQLKYAHAQAAQQVQQLTKRNQQLEAAAANSARVDAHDADRDAGRR